MPRAVLLGPARLRQLDGRMPRGRARVRGMTHLARRRRWRAWWLPRLRLRLNSAAANASA